MALANGSDYQSSVLWFLDDSPSGNAPDVLDQSTVETLDSLLFSFHAAYIAAASKDDPDAPVSRMTTEVRDLLTKSKGPSRDDLSTVVEAIGDTLKGTDKTVFAAPHVASSLKRLVLGLLDVAEPLRDKRLNRAVVTMSRTFSEKYKAATAA